MPRQAEHPRLTLVGAGPGDPELLSIKGARAIADADVILYDALVDERLLVYARPQAKCVFVGKRAGQHSIKQADLNVLIVRYALTHGHVVRLKGGDPFVFGRGHEELAYAEQFAIATAYIPGISSIASVPGLQLIPLTRRGYADSFWVGTGTTMTGPLTADLRQVLHANATKVILMGMRKLAEISNLFDEQGLGSLPAAIVMAGSTERERYGLGRAHALPEIATAYQLGAPAIVVIGAVVELHPQWEVYAELERESQAG
ncbi:MAG: uroporphyrinogen-III C-methyltransferase [Bacteroidota bacterium]